MELFKDQTEFQTAFIIRIGWRRSSLKLAHHAYYIRGL